jgi:hypothetical protein
MENVMKIKELYLQCPLTFYSINKNIISSMRTSKAKQFEQKTLIA